MGITGEPGGWTNEHAARARANPVRVMFLYWGRRGLTQFALELGRTAVADPGLTPSLSVSRQNEDFAAFEEFGAALLPVDTFVTDVGAVMQAWRIPLLRRRLAARLRRDRTQVVIDLMPHVWSSFLASAIQSAGARYVVVVHDAETHPGDYRSRVAKDLLDRAMSKADLVATLSEAVAGRLSALGAVPRAKLVALHHPDLNFGGKAAGQPPRPGEPWRLLFMGRILSYKALPLFLDAVDILRRDGIAVEVGVFGEGPLGTCAGRLSSMGATVVNRWLTAAEIADVLPRYHAMILSHIEASQSGMAAAALGAGLPVVAAPVGGLIEQIKHRHNGMLAQAADAPALADAIKELLWEPGLYHAIREAIDQTKEHRAMATFIKACVAHALGAGQTAQ